MPGREAKNGSANIFVVFVAKNNVRLKVEGTYARRVHVHSKSADSIQHFIAEFISKATFVAPDVIFMHHRIGVFHNRAVRNIANFAVGVKMKFVTVVKVGLNAKAFHLR